jgi:hypothetical protein
MYGSPHVRREQGGGQRARLPDMAHAGKGAALVDLTEDDGDTHMQQAGAAPTPRGEPSLAGVVHKLCSRICWGAQTP